MALEQGVRIEPDAIAVGKRGDRAVLPDTDGRAEAEDSGLVQHLQLGEGGDCRMKRFERGEFLLARMDQHRPSMAERHVGKALRRLLEEAAARQCERANLRVAERVVQHGRASAARVIADRLFRLEQGHASLCGKRRGRREAGNAAADHQDVGAVQPAPTPCPSREREGRFTGRAFRSRPCRRGSAGSPSRSHRRPGGRARLPPCPRRPRGNCRGCARTAPMHRTARSGPTGRRR